MVPLVALVLAVNTAPAPSSAQKTLHGILQKYLNERGKIERITAASVVIYKGPNSPVVTAAAGTATPANLFQIGSNTKAFTSTLVMQLEAQGKLNIDEPIGKWLPQYPAWKRLTLHHLLDMTAGLDTYDNTPEWQRDYARSPHRFFTAQELIAYSYRNGKPKVLHGWNYSNTGYLLTQLVLERVTGKAYGDLLRERIFTPLGLRDTYYDPHMLPAPAQNRLVNGYFYSDDSDNANLKPIYDTNVKPYSLSWAQAAGAIVSTPTDVARWVRVLYAGSLLPAKQHAEMQERVSLRTGKAVARTSSADPRTFGLGIAEAKLPGIGVAWFYEGETLGYRVAQIKMPKSGTIICVGLNSQPNAKQDHIGPLISSIASALNIH